MALRETFLLTPDAQAAQFEAERLFADLVFALVPVLPATAELLHVGATAIPGCLTKGDLDVVVRVPAVDFAAADIALAQRFSRNAGSTRTSDFASFEVPAHVPPVGIQLTVLGGAFDAFHRFADALRSDPDRLERYNDLKRTFHGQPMDEYRTAKAAFIEETLGSTPTGAANRTHA